MTKSEVAKAREARRASLPDPLRPFSALYGDCVTEIRERHTPAQLRAKREQFLHPAQNLWMAQLYADALGER